MLAAVLCRPVSIKLFYHRCTEKGMGIVQHYNTKYDNRIGPEEGGTLHNGHGPEILRNWILCLTMRTGSSPWRKRLNLLSYVRIFMVFLSLEGDFWEVEGCQIVVYSKCYIIF